MKNSQKKSNKKNAILEFAQKIEDKANNTLGDTLLDEDAKNENINIDYNDIVKNSTKARMSKIPWLIAIFLILISAITLGLMFFKSNPKTLFTQTIDEMFNYLENNINDNVYDITDGNITLDYKSLTNTEPNTLKNELSHIKWNIDYVKDNSKGLIYMDLKTKYDDTDLLNLNVYGNNINTYIYAPDLYEKYIKLKNNKVNYLLNSNDIKIILDGFNQAFDKVIAEEKIYSNKELLNINEKNIKTIKTRLVINNKNKNRICETFINSLKANDEFINSFAKTENIKSNDVKRKLDKHLIKIKKLLKKYNTLNLILYTNNKTNDFIRFSLVGDSEILSLTNNGNNKFDYEYHKNENKINSTFSFNVNENKTKYILNINYKKSINNNIVSENIYSLKFTSKKTNSFKKIDVSDSIDENKIDNLTKAQIYINIEKNSNLSRILNKINPLLLKQ